MHKSSCALHNGPAMLPRPCDCGEGMSAADWWRLVTAWVEARPNLKWAAIGWLAGFIIGVLV